MGDLLMSHPDLSMDQRAWFEAAVAEIDVNRIRDLNRDITAIHSPTGRERAAAEFMYRYLRNAGLEARYQSMGELSGHAIGRIPGHSNGTSLLLYAPIDTHLEGSDVDLPWAGTALRPDMVTPAIERDGLVIGLGAANPKAMVTTLAEAARVIAKVGVPLIGDLIVAYAGGGMPVDLHGPGDRGLSDGVAHLLARGAHADYALVMKPGNAVYHEEPGLCWFKISIRGSLGYAGMPHNLPNFRSSIAPAAKLILELEEWLPRYTEANTSGQVAPQGWISAVRAGWRDRVSFPSAVTEIYLDIRCNPRITPSSVRAQLRDALTDIQKRHSDIDLRLETIAALPGASTDPESWIVRSAVRAWEDVEGEPHQEPRRTSGQTDISMIRNLGIPTARTGWVSTPQNAPAELLDGLGGMGICRPADLAITCKKIVYSVIDTCMRSREETRAVRKP
jgi:acetylornithine deacetylase/succinyl-diaminopimelate desuccinylase-like protein